MKRQDNETPQKKTTLEGVVCSNPGSDIAPVYKRVYDDKLHRSIVKKVSETNLFEFIQASKSMTDLSALEKRLIATGEIPAVDPSLTGDGIDFTQYPRDIHEVYKVINDIDNNFNKLPASVQKVFGTKEAYLKSLMDGTYNNKVLSLLQKEVPADTIQEKEKVNE